jgi:hypothetical protein
MAVKFATKEERDEFLRQQFEPATRVPAASPPPADDEAAS